MKLTQGLLHENQGYGDFAECPFCGREPLFGVYLMDWENKAENVVKDCSDEGIPEDPSGFVLIVSCPHCTISMKNVWCFNDFTNKDKLLSSEYYEDKFNKYLLWRWNQRELETYSKNLAACAHNLVANLEQNSTINWPRVWKKRDGLKEALELYNAKKLPEAGI